MKTLKITVFLLLISIVTYAQEEKDYSLAKAKSISGKLVFHDIEPIEAYEIVFSFQNIIPDYDNATTQRVMDVSIQNAMTESGLQGGKFFDGIITKDGAKRDVAIKFKDNNKNNSLAKIGRKIQGVYIFIKEDPYNEYDFIGNISVSEAWNTDKEAYNKIITRAKKKYPNFDGIIFSTSDLHKADLIKFIGLELSGGGFRIGDKAVYKDGSKPRYGEIITLDNTKQKAGFKFNNEYGDEKIITIDYLKLSMISKEQHSQFIEQQIVEIEKHKFTTGQKVFWNDDNKLNYAEVVSLNDKNHDATVKFFNIYGEEKTTQVDFLKLDKLDESKYLEYIEKQNIEIQKHKFTPGQKVSYIDDKKMKYGEVVSLNANYKATVKYVNIYGEEKTSDIRFLDLEKVSEEKFKEEAVLFQKEILKYKFNIGEKVYWNKSDMFTNKNETISAEIVALNDLDHKATIKYLNKDNIEKQDNVSYLNLSKLK